MNGPLDNDADAFIADLVGGGAAVTSADLLTVAEDLLCNKETIAATILGVPLRPLMLADALLLMRVKNPYLSTVGDRDAATVMEGALEVMLLCQAGMNPDSIRSVFTDTAIRRNAVTQFAATLPANGMANIITAVDAFVKQATETQVSAKSPTEGTGSGTPGND